MAIPLARPVGAPERLGRYEILLPIAEGGMAQVFLGRILGPRGFERDVAIKLLRELDGPAGAIDPVAEGKLAAQIRHPNVVPVLDVGSDETGFFLVMEYVEGDSLAALQRAAVDPLPLAIALKIMRDALAGLAAAHELCDQSGRNLGVVHRDFSPHNILVGLDGIARLSDFGIAKVAMREGETQTGIVKGKVGYMAPEQATGKPLDRRCDVWAAGVVAWELFAGQRLFRGGDPVATAVEIVTGSPRALRDANSSIPAPLEAAVHYALAKDLDRRCPSASAFRECLLQAAQVSPASSAEVADFVRNLVGDKLAARRAEAERVVALRRAAPAATPTPTTVQPGARAQPVPVRAVALRRLGGALLLAAAGGLVLYRARASSARAPQAAPIASEPSHGSPEPPSSAAQSAATGVAPSPLGTPPLPSERTSSASDAAPHRNIAPASAKRARGKVGGGDPSHSASDSTTPPAPAAAPVPRPAASNPYE